MFKIFFWKCLRNVSGIPQRYQTFVSSLGNLSKIVPAFFFVHFLELLKKFLKIHLEQFLQIPKDISDETTEEISYLQRNLCRIFFFKFRDFFKKGHGITFENIRRNSPNFEKVFGYVFKQKGISEQIFSWILIDI